MNKEITIKEGWYWTVGDHYWDTVNDSREGVGLNRDLFDDSEKIIVTVMSKSGTGTKYELDSKAGLEWIRSHRSFKTIGTTKVGFVPRSLLKEI